jgi:hypothetical protein
VNFINQHFTPYSIRGARKRDFPPFFGECQPWWPWYDTLGNYLGRACYALAQGRFVADCALLHPISTAWALMSPQGPEPELAAYERGFKELSNWLLAQHVSFDYVDESLLAEHGRTREGELAFPSASYPLLILPAMRVLRSSTLGLLRRWTRGARGGAAERLVALQPLPTLLDAHRKLDLRAELPGIRVLPGAGPELAALLRPKAHLSVTDTRGGAEAAGVLAHTRALDGGRLIFLTNQSYTQTVNARVRLIGNGGTNVTELDALSGRRRPVPAARDGEAAIVLERSLHPLESAFLYFDECAKKPSANGTPRARTHVPRLLAELTGPWRVRFAEPNVLVLDTCRYRFIDAGGRASSWSGPSPVFEVQAAAQERGEGFDVELEFEAHSRLASHRAVDLGVELPERYAISVNGVPLRSAPSGAWRDPALHRLPVGRLLRRGRNRIVLRTRFSRPRIPGTYRYVPSGTELENCYLLGAFGVSLAGGAPRLVPAQRLDHFGDVTRLGYPFYAGLIRYETVFRANGAAAAGDAWIELPEVAAVAAEVEVNGLDRGRLFLPGQRVSLGRLRAGPNRLAVTIASSCRNCFGPLHRNEEGPVLFPHHFGRGPSWTDDYRVAPLGLLAPPRLFA